MGKKISGAIPYVVLGGATYEGMKGGKKIDEFFENETKEANEALVKVSKKLLPKSEMDKDKKSAKKSAAGKVLGGKEATHDEVVKPGGMGTPVAEYSEAGPFSCGQCWYLQSAEPRKDPKGFCNEPHMLRDPKTVKVTVGDKTLAVVDKVHGCCRFIDPVKPTEPDEKFVFAGDSHEESEEHGHTEEGDASEEEE